MGLIIAWINAVMKAALIADDFGYSSFVVINPDQTVRVASVWHMDNIFPLPIVCIEHIDGAFNVAGEPKFITPR